MVPTNSSTVISLLFEASMVVMLYCRPLAPSIESIEGEFSKDRWCLWAPPNCKERLEVLLTMEASRLAAVTTGERQF